MRKVCAAYSVAALVALSFSVNACGKSNSPNAPTSPSASASAQPGSGSAPGVSTGTTITGTILGGSGAASMRSASGLRPMSVGLTVTIVGTSMTVSIDGAGNFQLQNVPSGDVVLEIRGPGVDALAPLAGVAANSNIHLRIVVNGAVADIDENEVEMEGNRIEVEGRISAVNAGGLMITIGATVVSVPAGTPIRHDGNTELFSALHVGDRVHVHAAMVGSLVTATEVEDHNDPGAPPQANQGPGNDNDENEGEAEGPIAARAGTCPTLTFTVSARAVSTNAGTEFKDGACTSLVNGTSVEVKGTVQTNGSILATRVETKGRN